MFGFTLGGKVLYKKSYSYLGDSRLRGNDGVLGDSRVHCIREDGNDGVLGDLGGIGIQPANCHS